MKFKHINEAAPKVSVDNEIWGFRTTKEIKQFEKFIKDNDLPVTIEKYKTEENNVFNVVVTYSINIGEMYNLKKKVFEFVKKKYKGFKSYDMTSSQADELLELGKVK